VAFVSEFFDRQYRAFISPWVRSAVNEETAKWIRRLHPLRVSRYMFAEDFNPWMLTFKRLAPDVKAHRRPVSPDNPYLKLEKELSNIISNNLELFRNIRDLVQEFWFKAIYGNPWIDLFRSPDEDTKEEAAVCRPEWIDEIEKGGFAEGVVRIMVAAAHMNKSMQRRILKGYDQIIAADERLAKLKKSEFKLMIRKQACILNEDADKAMAALAKLIPAPKDRKDAFAIAQMITMADDDITAREKLLLRRIGQSLQLSSAGD
jgi:tellurite resistance protein